MTMPTAGPLHGQAARLRPVTTRDAARLTEILAHPEVAQWWGAFDLDRVQRELIDPADATVAFAVEADGRVIGLIQYWEENEPDYRHAAIDLFLDPAWHGRGLGAPTRSGPWPAFCSSTAATTASRPIPRPTTSGRSAPTSAWGSDRWGSCVATNAPLTAAGTTVCCWTCCQRTSHEQRLGANAVHCARLR